jgi:hypothetical protein
MQNNGTPKQLLVEDYQRMIAQVLQPGESLRIAHVCERLNWKSSSPPASKIKRILPPKNQWITVRTDRGLKEIRLLSSPPGYAGHIECRAVGTA